MKLEEAQTLVGFLKGAFPSMTPEQMEVYESSLVHEDARLASKAILDGIREWKFPPRYAEIVERIRVEKRRVTPRPDGTVDHFVRPTPFWVKRWVVARFVVDPPDYRPFREQYPDLEMSPAEDWMPEDAYVAEAEHLTVEQVRQAITPGLASNLGQRSL